MPFFKHDIAHQVKSEYDNNNNWILLCKLKRPLKRTFRALWWSCLSDFVHVYAERECVCEKHVNHRMGQKKIFRVATALNEKPLRFVECYHTLELKRKKAKPNHNYDCAVVILLRMFRREQVKRLLFCSAFYMGLFSWAVYTNTFETMNMNEKKLFFVFFLAFLHFVIMFLFFFVPFCALMPLLLIADRPLPVM